MRDDPGGIFASDEHRRLAGNLAQPRSIQSLNVEAFKDPHLPLGGEADIVEVLKDLEAEGYVKNVGVHEDAKALVDAVQDDEEAVSLHQSKAKALRERASARPNEYLQGEQWVLTERGLEALQAEHPNPPPPLTGDALKAAEESDKARGVGKFQKEA